MHQHLQEGEVVAPRAVEPAAAHEELRLLRNSELDRIEAAVRLARVHGYQTVLLIGPDDEAGVFHTQRLEQMFAQINLEVLSAHGLDRLAGEVDVDAVLPAIARIEGERCLERRILAADDARDVGSFVVLGGVGIPDVIGEAGGVSQQHAQRDRPLGRTQLRFALVVESFQDLRSRKVGKELAHRLVQLEFALFHELHGGGCGERLGHRRDPEHRIERHVGALGEVALAEGALIEDAVAGRCHGDDAGDLLGVRGLAEGLIDAGERVLPATLGGAGRRRADRAERGRSGDRGGRFQELTAILKHSCHE